MKTILLLLAVVSLSGCATYSASSYDRYGTGTLYVTTGSSVYFYGSSGNIDPQREAPIFYALAFNPPCLGVFARLAPRPQIRAPRSDHTMRQREPDDRPDRANRGQRREVQDEGTRPDRRDGESPDRQDDERRQR
jgi:hypothetical protein